MMELWGADTCEECVLTKNMMGKIPLEWKYVDVAMTKYEGFIPLLITDDGKHIEGIGPISRYVKQKLKELGIPLGIL